LQILKSTAVVISPAQSKGCKIYGQFVGFTYPSGIVAYILSGGFFSHGRHLQDKVVNVVGGIAHMPRFSELHTDRHLQE
jgi:hypothetical protein